MSESKFCHRCGAALADGATFCSKCGSPVMGATTQPTYTRGWERRNEKREKGEKHEKGEKGEKGREGDIAGALTGGLILIWLGITFYFAQVKFTFGTQTVTWTDWWGYFLLGLGVILIVQGLIRYAQHRYAWMGSFIGGAVVAVIGFASISQNMADFWPLIFVIIGIAVLASAVFGRRRMPSP
jgi:hypothetical protein